MDSQCMKLSMIKLVYFHHCSICSMCTQLIKFIVQFAHCFTVTVEKFLELLKLLDVQMYIVFVIILFNLFKNWYIIPLHLKKLEGAEIARPSDCIF